MGVAFHFSCPSCGADRLSQRAPCDRCDWPWQLSAEQRSFSLRSDTHATLEKHDQVGGVRGASIATGNLLRPVCGIVVPRDESDSDDLHSFRVFRNFRGRFGSSPPMERVLKRHVQFRLRTMFVFMTIASIAFAIVGQLGVDGVARQLGAACLLAVCFLPVVEYALWMKKQLDDCDL